MTTLMSTGNSSGETGRCNARCYNAKGTHCHCCCGGRNHGVGYGPALANVRGYVDDMISDWGIEHPDDITTIPDLVRQLDLFV